LKNWRPITLLCVDFKLATSYITSRLKPILQNIISQTQKGFLRERYIGEYRKTTDPLVRPFLVRTKYDKLPLFITALEISVLKDFIHLRKVGPKP
jgi:hypothetical protein